MFNILAGKHWE